jgi:hypothetical protein
VVNKSNKTAPKKAVSTQHLTVLVDTEFPGFLDDLESLESSELDSVQASINKIQQMTWNDIYKISSKTPGNKRGLNFEPLEQRTAKGNKIASIRVTGKFRARVCRDGRYMRFISLHPDHDSAYDQVGGEEI